MKTKSFNKFFSKIGSSIKNLKNTEPQLFWIIFICLYLSLSFAIIAIIKLSILKNNQVVYVKPVSNENSTVNNTNQSEVADTLKISPTIDPSIIIKPFNASKVSWLDNPQKIEALDILANKTDVSENEYETIYFSQTKFLLIGNLSDGSQLLDVFIREVNGPGDNFSVFRLLKTTNNEFTFIYNEDQKDQGLYYLNRYFSNKVAISFGSYPELNPPESISLNGINLDNSWCSSNDFNDLNNPEFFGSTNNGDFYIVNEKSDIDGVVSRRFYLKLKDRTYCSYSQTYDFITDNLTLSINWNDDSSNEDQFNKDFIKGSGCGESNNSGPEIIKKDSNLLQNKVAVATYNGITFYQIKDVSNPIVKYLYQEYKTRFDASTSLDLTIEEFALTKNHFLYQDATGNWVIFTNMKYGIIAECGKPVIYLYPTKETQVKVQVGAQITKSEPTYPSQGWLVAAKPNGELTYQNQSYPYLFWEGLGNGIYPDYKDQGTLVSQKDLVSTVYQQLSQLGLNQKESADFMEFWQPKLPKTPYIRLTWLNTKDMDTLAPLNVYPRPGTSIRVFLEFEGLDKPITLKPQELTAPKRNGFTLIEWGGLLLKARE